MPTTRSKFAIAAGALATTGIVRFPAGAAEFTYKMAIGVPLTQSVAARALEGAVRTYRDSGGRLEIKVFPDNALGGDVQMLTETRLGAIEFYSVPTDVLGGLVPVAGMPGLPFLVSDRNAALGILSGAFGSYVRGAVAKAGLYQFARSWDGSFRQVQNWVRPIFTPPDLRGLKIRVQESPVNIALFKAIGATPTPTPGAQIYVNLQTRLIDGTSVPIVVIETYKLYELEKYNSYTNHSWNSFTIVANADAWQRLPRNLQDIVERNMEAARNLNNADYVKNDASMEGRLKARGILFNTTDIQAFRKAVRDAGLYSQWKASYGPEAWALLERSVGTLG